MTALKSKKRGLPFSLTILVSTAFVAGLLIWGGNDRRTKRKEVGLAGEEGFLPARPMSRSTPVEGGLREETKKAGPPKLIIDENTRSLQNRSVAKVWVAQSRGVGHKKPVEFFLR